MKKILLVLVTLAAASCTRTLPVAGYIGNNESFYGTATRKYPSMSGDLAIKSDKGTLCTGTYTYLSGQEFGSGVFNCNDGRSGEFTLSVEGHKGQGSGKTNTGETISFTFNRIG